LPNPVCLYNIYPLFTFNFLSYREPSPLYCCWVQDDKKSSFRHPPPWGRVWVGAGFFHISLPLHDNNNLDSRLTIHAFSVIQTPSPMGEGWGGGWFFSLPLHDNNNLDSRFTIHGSHSTRLLSRFVPRNDVKLFVMTKRALKMC